MSNGSVGIRHTAGLITCIQTLHMHIYKYTRILASSALCLLLSFVHAKQANSEPLGSSVPTQQSAPSQLVAQIPFKSHNGSIILQVKINDFARPLDLLFDTGANGMAVGQELADEMGLVVTRENNASVVGGTTTIKVSDNNSIQLDTLTMGGMGIAIFPKMSRADVDGVIGNTLLHHYIVHIDYDKSLLSLYTFGTHTYTGEGQRVNIHMPSSVMLIPAELEIVEGKKYSGQFVFDTGASYDLICFRPFVRRNRLLISGFKPDFQSSTVSMGISSPTFYGPSHQFTIPPLPALNRLPVTLMGGSVDNEKWEPGADGSIGVRLLSRYNLTINLAEGEIFFSPNRLHSLPHDFVIRGYLFGWDNQGELRVLGTAGFNQENSTLQKGDLIQAVDDISSQQLVSNTDVIDELKGSSDRVVRVKLADDSIVEL